MLGYQTRSIVPIGYTNSYVEFLMAGAISWRSVKQVGIANSTMKAGSIAALEATVEAEWLSSFLMDNGLVPLVQSDIIIIIAERLKVRRNLISMR